MSAIASSSSLISWLILYLAKVFPYMLVAFFVLKHNCCPRCFTFLIGPLLRPKTAIILIWGPTLVLVSKAEVNRFHWAQIDDKKQHTCERLLCTIPHKNSTMNTSNVCENRNVVRHSVGMCYSRLQMLSPHLFQWTNNWNNVLFSETWSLNRLIDLVLSGSADELSLPISCLAAQPLSLAYRSRA